MSNNNANNCSGTSWPSNTIVWTGTISGGSWSVPIPTGFDPAPVDKKENKDGCNCKKCKEFYPYAEPNQDDGTLICYSCRHGW